MDFNAKRTWGPTPKYDLVKNYKPKNNDFIFIAGPCSVESKEQINLISNFVAQHGATHLRGGVFRAGTYPRANFGLIEEELILDYYTAAKKNNLKTILEVLDYSPKTLLIYEKYADYFQVGSRQMQNYTLLKKLAETGKPIFLKRNQGGTLDEWLGAAEYLLSYGCEDLALIERGSSTFLNHVRWDLSLSIIAAVKRITKIPIICDPSHGTGRRDLVEKMALAGIMAGSNGVLIETHYDPEISLSDAEQAISFNDFEKLVKKINLTRKLILEMENI